MANKPELKIDINENKIGTLLFDKPVSGTNSNGEWNMYTLDVDDTEMVYFASQNAHNTLKEYKTGDTVSIDHKPRQQGGSMYIVSLVGQSKIESTKSRGNALSSSGDKDLPIKWGMAFNNATRLVANTSYGNSISDKVSLIKDIMPSMFEIACSMPTNQIEEKVQEQKLVESETVKSDDDLPF